MLIIHCASHKLNLIIADSVKTVPSLSALYNFVRKVLLKGLREGSFECYQNEMSLYSVYIVIFVSWLCSTGTDKDRNVLIEKNTF